MKWGGGRNNRDDREFARIPRDMHDWAAYRCRAGSTTAGWRHILLEATGSEEAAFYRFFELLEEHEKRQPTVIARLRIQQSPDPLGRRLAKEVALVTYTDDPGFFALSEDPGAYLSCEGFYPSLGLLSFEVSCDLEHPKILDERRFAKVREESREVGISEEE